MAVIFFFTMKTRTRQEGSHCMRCVGGCDSLTIRRVGLRGVPTDVALTRKLLRDKTKCDRLTHGDGGRFNVGYNND